MSVEATGGGGLGIDMGVVRGLITALTMLVYAGIFWWAYRKGNRERFESDALLPFADDERLPRDASRRSDRGEEER